MSGNGIEIELVGGGLPPYEPLAPKYLVISWEVTEAVSRPARGRIEIHSRNVISEVDLLDQSIEVKVTHGNVQRCWSLIVDALRYVGFHSGWHHYYLEVIHPIGLLARRFDVRAFQNVALQDIVKKLLIGCGLASSDVTWKVDVDPKRTYIVQYRESDLRFLERILAEEGLSYYISDIGGSPFVLFSDTVADLENNDLGELALIDGASGYGVTDFELESVLESAGYSTSDYKYASANANLSQAVKVAGTDGGDWFEYPGGFEDADRGKLLAERRAEAFVSRKDHASGRSECPEFGAGKLFTLTSIDVEAGSADETVLPWLLTFVSHRWVLRSEATAATNTAILRVNSGVNRRREESSYFNRFACVPKAPFYRQVFPRLSQTVEGPIGAIVTTKGGEPITTESNGDAKAQFFWDRLNAKDDTASCWLRVIQIPIGGSLAVARKDWEILVRHLYGDPNRPVLVGRLDNGAHQAPYAYPAAGTAMSWKTQASPGGAKINEFSMEDSGGSQGFNMTAGTNYTNQTNNNMTEEVACNEEITVDVDHDVTVSADQKTTIGTAWTKTVSADAGVTVNSDRTLTIGAADTVTVSGNLAEKIVGADSETVGTSYMALAGMSIGRTSKGSQSLTVGGALITAAGLSVSRAVGGSCSETIGGAKIVAAGGSVTESVVGALSMTVGGVFVNAAAANCSSSSTGANKVKVGGVAIISGGSQVQIQAKKITIDVGAAAAMLGGGGIMALTPGSCSFVGIVTIKASGALKIKGAPNLPG